MVITGMAHFQSVCKRKLVNWYNSQVGSTKIDLDNVFIVWNKILLSPSRPMPLRSAQNPHNCWVFETIYHSSCVLFDRPLHSKSCIKIVVVCRHIFL